MTTLAFLNLGGPEIALLVVLYVLFFGVDKLPAAARQLGKLRAQVSSAQRRFEREMKTSEELEIEELRRFELAREEAMRQSADPAVAEDSRVRDAARALGIGDADTRPVAELRREMALRFASDSPVTDASKV